MVSDADDDDSVGQNPLIKRSHTFSTGRNMNKRSDGEVKMECTENEPSSVATPSNHGSQDGQIAFQPTPYEIEVGLAMRTTPILAHVEAHLMTLKPPNTRSPIDTHDQIVKILHMIGLLDFFKTRSDLSQYLENRLAMPGKKLQARMDWNTSNPGEILDALQTVKTTTADAKIHRAFGQTLLFSSVNAQVATGYTPSVKGRLQEHIAILDGLALKKAGPVSKLEKFRMIDGYRDEYNAGQRWRAITDWFGGNGAVLVFVIAGKPLTSSILARAKDCSSSDLF